MWLEVAADRVPEFQSRELYEVLITVRDNLWLDHYFTKRVVVRVLAYPQLVELSPGYLVQEGAAAGTVVGDLACFDPDQGQVSFGLSGDDAGLFRIDGSQLLAAANLPRLVTQGFYDIVVTCTDWNGLSYEHAAPPTCEDICECANAPCAGDGCTDYNKAAVACSTTTGFASEVQAGTEVSVAVSGNVARDVVEVYAIRSPLAESGEKVQWVPVAVSVEAAPAGCAQDSGDCQVNAVVTPRQLLRYRCPAMDWSAAQSPTRRTSSSSLRLTQT